MPAVAWILVAYLIGSIPFGILIGWAKGIDVRRGGSGNIGATNVSRLLGRPLGITCFVLDVLKGLVPVLAAGLAGGLMHGPLSAGRAWLWLAVGAAAVLGHVFPVWLKFRGGKGVATGLGSLMGYWPVLTMAAGAGLLTWAVVAAIWRYVSLASMVAAVLLPLYVFGIGLWLRMEPARLLPFVLVTVLLTALIVVRHRGNLMRLWQGSESKIGQSVKAEARA